MYLQIVETYNDKKYENSSGIHSGGSDLDSSGHIDQTNQNFTLNSRCSSTELRSEYSAFNERFRSPSMKVRIFIYILTLDLSHMCKQFNIVHTRTRVNLI